MAGITQSQLNMFLTALNFSGKNSKGKNFKLEFMSRTNIMLRKSVQSGIIQASKEDQQLNLDKVINSEIENVRLQADGCFPTRGTFSKSCLVTLMGQVADSHKILAQIVTKKRPVSGDCKNAENGEPSCLWLNVQSQLLESAGILHFKQNVIPKLANKSVSLAVDGDSKLHAMFENSFVKLCFDKAHGLKVIRTYNSTLYFILSLLEHKKCRVSSQNG